MTHSFPTRRSSDLLSHRAVGDLSQGRGDVHRRGEGAPRRRARQTRRRNPRLHAAGSDPQPRTCRLQIARAHVELQSLMRISYAVFCLTKKKKTYKTQHSPTPTNNTYYRTSH